MRNSEKLRQGVGAGARARIAAVPGASAGIEVGTGSSTGAGTGIEAGDELQVGAGAGAGSGALLGAGAGGGGGGTAAASAACPLHQQREAQEIAPLAAHPCQGSSAMTCLITRTNKQPQRNDATSLGHLRFGSHDSLHSSMK